MSHRVGSSCPGSLFSSALARGPSGDGSGGDPARADEVLGGVWSDVPLLWTRCGQENADGQGSPVHGMEAVSDAPLPLPPFSFQLPQFPVKETWAGNLRAAAHYMKGRPKCIKGTRRAHGSDEGGGERGEGRRLGFEEQRDACTVPIDEIHPQRNPRPITACRSSGHPSRHRFISSCCLWAQRGRPEGRGRCGALQWTAQARDSPGSLWDICFAFFYCRIWEHCFLGPLFPSTYAVGTQ